jgi:hypothetical protein
VTWFLVQQSVKTSTPLGVVAYSPLSISGLVLWFDAADAATITSSAGAVSQWNDKSVSGIIATQATGTKQPTVLTAAQNGLNTIGFTASNFTQLDFNSAVNVDPNYTIIAVFKRSAVNTVGLHVGHLTVTNYGGVYYSDNNIYATNSSGYASGAPGTASNATYNILTAVISGATGVLRFNRAAFTSPFTASGGFGATYNTMGFTFNLGSSNASVAEVIVVNRALSSPEYTTAENYLNTRWATP